VYHESSDTYGPPTAGRSFALLCSDAADLLHAIKRLETDKLSAKAFCRAANEAAGLTPQQVLDLMDRVTAAPNRSVLKLVRNLSALVIAGRVSEVPSPGKLEKFARAYAYGEPGDTALQLVALGMTAAQAFALAVHLANMSNPDSFGTLEDADDRGARLREYRQLLDRHYAAMRESYNPGDLLIGGERSAGDVAVPRGYVKLTFKLAPHLTPDDLEWTRLLTEHLLQTAGVRTEREPVKRKSVLPVKEITRRRARSESRPAEEAPA